MLSNSPHFACAEYNIFQTISWEILPKKLKDAANIKALLNA